MKLLITILILLTALIAHAQSDFNSAETLKVLFDKLYFAENDSVKRKVNTEIISVFEEYLNADMIQTSDLKDIKNLYIAVSDKSNVFLFTWAFPLTDNTTEYFGFVRYYSKDRNTYYTEKLIRNKKLQADLNTTVHIDNWYGAVYYDMITVKYKGSEQYILLGWDANDLLTNKKLIDIIEIREGDYPVLGKNVFETENGLKKRLIFEYAERVNMTLKYDKKMNMIIWDHLSPSKPELAGHFEYYGPDMTFDGITFENGIWKHVKDIQLY